MKICSICNQPIPVKTSPNGHTWDGGNNAEPVAPGRCCDTCNERFVVPARVAAHFANRKEDEGATEKGKKQHTKKE